MSRKPRLQCPGGIYHVIKRGNNKEYIFNNNEDKKYLINLFKEYSEKLGFEIFGFVIMSNHYHFIIKISDVPLKNIMHRINNKFSRNFNIKYNRTGHVFEGRYTDILVKNDEQLLSLLRYVHQNPLEARMCKKASDYPWSSDRIYRSNIQNGLVNIDFILDIFSENRPNALKAYIEFMDGDKKEANDVFENAAVIGDVKTKTTVNDIITDKKSLDQILIDITKDEVIYNEMKEGSRKRYLTTYKMEYIDVALKLGYTMKKIGESISISEAAVFRLHNK